MEVKEDYGETTCIYWPKSGYSIELCKAVGMWFFIVKFERSFFDNFRRQAVGKRLPNLRRSSVSQGNVTKCPLPIFFKYTGVKGDGKE